MGVAATPVGSLFARAKRGWSAQEPEIALGLLSTLREKLQADFEIVETSDDLITFIADFNRIRLRGSGDSACLLVAGDVGASESAIRKFWESVSGPEQLVIAFALSPGAFTTIHAVIPKGYVCVFSPSDIAALLETHDAIRRLREELRRQIPLVRLIPFIIKHSVHGNMFYGRRNELQKLLDEDAENFAIAGQGRIGKSSDSSEKLVGGFRFGQLAK